ncbi:MAG: helix-turn-helix transcriptional regulator [Metamycoplasmataceae bacterium]
MSNLAKKEEKEIKHLRDLRIINPKKIEESIKFIEKIHGETDGYITLAVKNNVGFSQWHYKLEETNGVIEHLHRQKTDSYVSINSFYISVRNTNNIRKINALYIDIDNHNDTVTKEMVQALIKYLKKHYYNKNIPEPTITVFTGRGLQLIFLLENLPSQALKFWQNIENELAKRLRSLNFNGFQLDESCTDVTRIFRLPGTINTKSKTYAEIIEINDNVYRLDELKKEYFKYVPKTTRKRKARVLNITAGKKGLNTYELHWKRREDIERLQNARNGECNGYRELMCFLYRYYSCLVESNCNEALNRMLKFNQKFSEPLPLHEVIKATESAEKAYKEYIESVKNNKGDTTVFENGEFKLKGYNYTNARLIKILNIIEKEQKELLILINKDEKYRRNNNRRTPKNENGLTKKQQALQNLKIKVLELKKENLSNRQIADILKISEYKVRDVLK